MSDPDKRADVQDAVEDATGFNFRSLKTLRDLFLKPNAVFRAYAARDRVIYTPALRLWFGLVGLQVLISALWGGWSGVVRRQVEGDSASREAYTHMSGGRLDEFITHYGQATDFAQPVIVAATTALSIFVLGWFNKALAWSARLNIAMGVLAAGSLIGLALMPMLMLPDQYFAIALWAPTFIVIGVYFITALRGAPGVLSQTTAGAWGKAALYTLALTLLLFLAGLLMSIAATVYAIVRLGAAG